MKYLENFHIKDQAEKLRFFEMLPNEIEFLPDELYAQILKHLLGAADFPEFTWATVPSIMKIAYRMTLLKTPANTPNDSPESSIHVNDPEGEEKKK